MSVTVTNTSGLPKGIQSIGLSGSGAFTLTGNNCPPVIAGGKTCTLKVTFQPTLTATYSGNLKISESSGAKANVTLSGSATVNGN
jgi:type 1 fimbria pilin